MMKAPLTVACLVFVALAFAQESPQIRDMSDHPLAMVRTGSQFMFIDETARLVIGRSFEGAANFSQGLAAVKSGGNWSYIDTHGNSAFSGQFRSAGDFSEGLAAVGVDDKFGFIDRSGRMVIKPLFDEVGYFSSELAPVKINGKYGYIGKDGEMKIAAQFEFASSFHAGYATIKQDGILHYIDDRGDLIATLDRGAIATPFYEGLAAFSDGRKWGFLAITGDIVIAPSYDEANAYSDGVAAVGIGRKYWFIDHYGKRITRSRYSIAMGCDGRQFSEGLVVIQNQDRCEFINKEDKVVVRTTISPSSVISPFSNGLARVDGPDGRCGYIDKSGKMAISQAYSYCSDFHSPQETAAHPKINF